MNKYMRLDKKARAKILEDIGKLDVINKDTVIALIIPHYTYDFKTLYNQDIGRIASSLVAKYKDENNVRSFFNYNDADGKSNYANIDKTQDKKILEQIYKNLNKKQMGISKSINKVGKRYGEISGQITIDDISLNT